MMGKSKQKPQRGWMDEERGTVRKDWGGKLRVALAFPNRYGVGMSNLGFQSVYAALNRQEDIVCERVFLPEPQDMPYHRENPGKLLSVESRRPVMDFHLLAFSVSYENDYESVLTLMALAGIPVRPEQRTAAHPLVAAGGVAVFLNPEPLAPFLDFIFVGEAEALVPDFLAFWKDMDSRETPPERPEILQSLARDVPGIYVPSLYEERYAPDGTLDALEPLAGSGAPERVAYRRADLASAPVCSTAVMTPNTEFSDVLLVEIGRGCGRGCRFCAAGFVYRPLRFQPAEKIVSEIEGRIEPGGRVGLVSAAVSDHPEIATICETLGEKGAALSFSSLRADAITPEMFAALEAGRHQAVAIAPEAGSERLRRVINKNLSLDEIESAAERLTEAGILHLKLYFMIGLPTETLEDLEELVDLTKKIQHHVVNVSRGRRKLGSITLSIHSFVPKAFTPFQWVPFAGVKELKDRARWIQTALKKVPNVRVHFDLPKWAYVQALLARGDRRAARFLERVALDGDSWSQAFRNVPFNVDFWVMRERGADERFPWEIIDHGVNRKYLREEYQRALEARQSPRCEPESNCRRCGVCAP